MNSLLPRLWPDACQWLHDLTFATMNESKPRLLAPPLTCRLCVRAKWTSLNGCSSSALSPSVGSLLLVTSTLLVSSYLTLQRHRCIVNLSLQGPAKRAAQRFSHSRVCLFHPFFFVSAGVYSQAASGLFLHLTKGCFCTPPSFEALVLTVVRRPL